MSDIIPTGYSLKMLIRKIVQKFGYDTVRYEQQKECMFPSDFSKEEIDIIRSVEPFTMTSPERIFGLIQAVKYVVNHNIPGDIVECGVWKGGSMMAVAKTLLSLNSMERHLYLFDTFEGMPAPGEYDVSLHRVKAIEVFDEKKINNESSNWNYASLNEVENAMYGTEYDKAKIRFIKGKVEKTVPKNAPEAIAILRLDTDWYESTLHELIHLFPRLSPRGVVIIDDYGAWEGARKATDEYFTRNNIPILLNRMDDTGRIGVKLC
jgi:hypothetical protein